MKKIDVGHFTDKPCVRIRTVSENGAHTPTGDYFASPICFCSKEEPEDMAGDYEGVLLAWADGVTCSFTDVRIMLNSNLSQGPSTHSYVMTYKLFTLESVKTETETGVEE